MKLLRSLRTLTRVSLPLFLAAILQAQAPSPADEAAAFIKKNDQAAADALLTPLTGEGSQNAAAFFQLGNLRLHQQRADDAASAFEKAGKLDPSKAEYFSRYAIALSAKMPGAKPMDQGMLAMKMKKAFDAAVALDPNHIPALIGLARFYSNAPEFAGGSLERAKSFAERIQALNPFLGAIELSLVAEKSEDFALALTHVDAACKLEPANPAPHAAASRILAQLGRNEEAQTRLQRSVELKPRPEPAKPAAETTGR